MACFTIYNKTNNHEGHQVFYDILNEINSLLVFLIKPEDDYYWRHFNLEFKYLANSLLFFKYLLFITFISAIFLPYYKELNFSRKNNILYYYIKKNLIKGVIISILICDLLMLSIIVIDHSVIVINNPHQCMNVVREFKDINKFIILEILHIFIGIVFFSKFYRAIDFKDFLARFEKKIYTFVIILFTILLFWFIYNNYGKYLNRYLLTIFYYFAIIYTIFSMFFILKIFFNFEKKNIFLIKTLIISQLLIFLLLIYSDNYNLFKSFIIFVIFVDSFMLKDELNKIRKYIESKIIFK
jgi:hypothetical protein